jgi:hypothetical protein
MIAPPWRNRLGDQQPLSKTGRGEHLRPLDRGSFRIGALFFPVRVLDGIMVEVGSVRVRIRDLEIGKNAAAK